MQQQQQYHEVLGGVLEASLDNFGTILCGYSAIEAVISKLDAEIAALDRFRLKQRKQQAIVSEAITQISNGIEAVRDAETAIQNLHFVISNKTLDIQTKTYFSRKLELFRQDIQAALDGNGDRLRVMLPKLQRLENVVAHEPIEAERHDIEEIYAYASQVVQEMLLQYTKTALRGLGSVGELEELYQNKMAQHRSLFDFALQQDQFRQQLERLISSCVSQLYQKQRLRQVERALQYYYSQNREYISSCVSFKKPRQPLDIGGSFLDFVLQDGEGRSVRDLFRPEYKQFMLPRRPVVATEGLLESFLQECGGRQAQRVGRYGGSMHVIYALLRSELRRSERLIGEFYGAVFGAGRPRQVRELEEQHRALLRGLFGQLGYCELLGLASPRHGNGEVVARLLELRARLVAAPDYTEAERVAVGRLLAFAAASCRHRFAPAEYARLEAAPGPPRGGTGGVC